MHWPTSVLWPGDLIMYMYIDPFDDKSSRVSILIMITHFALVNDMATMDVFTTVPLP